MHCPRCGEEYRDNYPCCPNCGTQNPNPQQQQPTKVFLGYAGFWRRAVAIVIDFIIIQALVSLFVQLIYGDSFNLLVKELSLWDLMSSDIYGGVNMLSIAITWSWFAVWESSRFQATPGKMVMGLQVTDLEGRRISFARATGRHFAKVISSFTLGIGFLMAGVSRRKQALHDLIAECLILRK